MALFLGVDPSAPSSAPTPPPRTEPFSRHEDVAIVVDDDIATLTGTVDSWSERQSAAENAYEGGAVWVDNDLGVK